VPAAGEPLIASAVDFIGRVRHLELDKPPGMAEAIDWVSALAALDITWLVRADILRTLSTVAKSPDDRVAVSEALDGLGYP
jgi:MoxR-like ATPase